MCCTTTFDILFLVERYANNNNNNSAKNGCSIRGHSYHVSMTTCTLINPGGNIKQLHCTVVNSNVIIYCHGHKTRSGSLFNRVFFGEEVQEIRAWRPCNTCLNVAQDIK